MEKVRVDRWLWSVRIFKSRTLSTKACKKKKVKINDDNVKPSYLLSGGETIMVKKNGFDLVFKVDGLLNKRVSASNATPYFTDMTPPGELTKYKDWYIGKAQPEIRGKGEGRPTKKERREIEDYKDQTFMYDLWDDEDDE